MSDYNSIDFDPPAPVARVSLRNPETGTNQREVPMLLDSGADVSLVPLTAVNQLQLKLDPAKRYELMSFDGSTSLAPVVRLELDFCNRVFRGQFLVIDQPWGILGRNVLNTVALLFDGPRLKWEETPESTAQ